MVKTIGTQLVGVNNSNWWALRHSWDEPEATIFCRGELVDYFIITSEVHGYAHIDISLKGDKKIDGWIPKSNIG